MKTWVPGEPDEDCWRVPTLPEPNAGTEHRTTVRLPSNVTISNEYTVLGYANQCFGEGPFRFSSGEPYRITIDGEQRFQSENGDVLEFSLRFN